jgi:hypothetical protein
MNYLKINNETGRNVVECVVEKKQKVFRADQRHSGEPKESSATGISISISSIIEG